MNLRLMTLVVHRDHADQALDLLDHTAAVGVWTSEVDESRSLIRILLPAEWTESLGDRLSLRFGATKDFRMLLLPVEATLPPFEPVREEAKDADGEEKSADANGGNGGNGDGTTRSERISREELYHDIAGGLRLSNTFLATVVLSAAVAAIGLIRGDVAIIIGAMVIAPFLGPNMALSLATTLGDTSLALRSLKVQGAGILAALLFSGLIGFALGVAPNLPAILARTRPGIGDLILALASGSAGALAFTSGVPVALTGVMVAVALLPPLVVAGMLVGAGHFSPGIGAFLLYLLNVASVNLAGVITFFVQGVRPRTYWNQGRARQATRAAMFFWSLLIAIFLGMVFWLFGA